MRAAAEGASRYRVLGDQPFAPAPGASPLDPFSFGSLAEQLKALILESRRSSPFTIGIEAGWGRGKSTLMQWLERELRKPDPDSPVRVETVSYNAWTAEGEDVLEGLVKSVLQAMDRNVLRRALRNKKLLTAVKIPVLLVAGWLRVGDLVNQAWDTLSADARTRNEVNGLLREAMRDWSARVAAHTPGPGGEQLLVVFIDDLDRCSPQNVLKVFEGLKLYLDAPGFVFVIGYDEGIVSEAVADRRRYSAREMGRDYVEKIVQIVFRIPQPTDDEVEELLDHVLAESNTSDLFDGPARKLVIERNGRNPRRMKRFVNRFILDFQLDDAAKDLDAELLIRLLILETYFPEFARLLPTLGEDGKNAICEFLEFAACRESLRRNELDQPNVQELFQYYGITEAATAAESLEKLQAEVPEVFVRLAQDDDFVSLARSLASADDQELIVQKVRRSKQRQVVPPPEAVQSEWSAAEYPDRPPLLPPEVNGRRILWIGDNPENSAHLVGRLRASGAHVATATTGEEAAKLLPSFAADVLISDLGRGGRAEAGLEDLAAFRRDGLFAGPAIFYTARVTSAQRDHARELGAVIVSGDDDLWSVLLKMVAPTAAAAPEAAAAVPA